MSCKFYLYRMYDCDDCLMYVGISIYPTERLNCHSKEAWFSNVLKITFEKFTNKNDCVEAETLAIKLECPILNIFHSINEPTKQKQHWKLYRENKKRHYVNIDDHRAGACGLQAKVTVADPRLVTCMSCMKTYKWKASAILLNNPTKQIKKED